MYRRIVPRLSRAQAIVFWNPSLNEIAVIVEPQPPGPAVSVHLHKSPHNDAASACLTVTTGGSMRGRVICRRRLLKPHSSAAGKPTIVLCNAAAIRFWL